MQSGGRAHFWGRALTPLLQSTDEDITSGAFAQGCVPNGDRGLFFDSRLSGTADLAAAFLLHERHGKQILPAPLGVDGYAYVARERTVFSRIRNTHLAQGAQNGSVTEFFAGVFPTGHAGVQMCFGDCQPDLRCIARFAYRCFSYGHVEFRVVPLSRRPWRQRDIHPRSGRGLFDRLPRLSLSTADKLRLAVDHHLWRIHVPASQRSGIFLLAGGPLARGQRGPPPEMCPVIDVLFERDDLRVRYGWLLFQLGQQSGGWRATGAPFRGEQLDD